MSKFLKIISEQLPTGSIPTGSIPTGSGLKNVQQASQPRDQAQVSTRRRVGSAMRKIGSGFEKIKNAVNTAKNFSETGDWSILKNLGQQLINKELDMDTYKISVFGDKNYDQVILIDKELITKINEYGMTNNESTKIIRSSGLLNEKKFLKILEAAEQTTGEEQLQQQNRDPIQTPTGMPEFRFRIANERSVGSFGKQYTFVPTTSELETFLNTKKIKFVTFLRDNNTSQENIFGNLTFENNTGKLQFFDMENQFIRSLETQVKFEWAPQDKVYKIGSNISTHSFADIEETEKMLAKGILKIYPKDRMFRIESVNPQVGQEIYFHNIFTKQRFTGKYNPVMSPDKKMSFVVMTDVKPAESGVGNQNTTTPTPPTGQQTNQQNNQQNTQTNQQAT